MVFKFADTGLAILKTVSIWCRFPNIGCTLPLSVLWSHQTPVIHICFWCVGVQLYQWLGHWFYHWLYYLVCHWLYYWVCHWLYHWLYHLLSHWLYHWCTIFFAYLSLPSFHQTILWVMFTTCRLEIDHLWQDVFEFFLLQNCVMIRKSYQIFRSAFKDSQIQFDLLR